MSNATEPVTVDQAWEVLTEQCGVSEDTLRIITSINGWGVETLEDVLFVVTGYRSFDGLAED